MSQVTPAEHHHLPWYDSSWLSCYLQAKDIIEYHYSNRLTEFEQAFNILRTDSNFKQQKVSNLIPEFDLTSIKQLIKELSSEQLEKHELLNFGRFVVHDHPVFDKLQEELTEELSRLAGESLEPSYNFLALYNNLGYCQPHMDAPNAKWTLDICLEQSQVWPIYFSQIQPWPEDFDSTDRQWQKSILNDSANQFTEYKMKEGDALFFSGSSQWHYRPRIEQRVKKNFCNLLFLHYIPKGTRELVNPNLWANLFSMPELNRISFDFDRTE